MEVFKLESFRTTHGNNPTHLMAKEQPTQIPVQTQELLYTEANTHSWLSYLQEENKHQVLTEKKTTSTNGYANHHLALKAVRK